MNKNPILVFTGLAIAALAVVAGVTRDRWMPPQMAVAEKVVAPAEAPAKVEEQQAAAPAVKQTAVVAEVPAKVEVQPQAAAPAAEQPAVAAETPAKVEEQPQAAAPVVEQPAVTAEAPAKVQDQLQAEAPAAEKTAAATAPSFDTVRVEKTGEAVIAGRAEAGSEVVLKLDGQAIGKTTANAEGAFVVVPDQPLPAGSGALTIEAKTGTEPQATLSEQTVAVIVPEQGKQDVLVAVMSPTEPTKVLQKSEPEKIVAAASAPAEPAAAEQPVVQPKAAATPSQVSLDAVDYDASGNIVFSGRGEPGTGARIYVDNSFAGDAAVGGDGRWSFSGTTTVASGVHALRIDGIGSDGKVINRIEVPFFREETRKVAAAAPTEAPALEAAPAVEPAAAPAPAIQPEAALAAAAPAKPKDGRIVIQPGNNLWRISKVIYGSGVKYTLLYDANKDQIRDPDKIYPGQVFMTPDVVPPESIDPKRRDPLKPEENAASGQ